MILFYKSVAARYLTINLVVQGAYFKACHLSGVSKKRIFYSIVEKFYLHNSEQVVKIPTFSEHLFFAKLCPFGGEVGNEGKRLRGESSRWQD